MITMVHFHEDNRDRRVSYWRQKGQDVIRVRVCRALSEDRFNQLQDWCELTADDIIDMSFYPKFNATNYVWHRKRK